MKSLVTDDPIVATAGGKNAASFGWFAGLQRCGYTLSMKTAVSIPDDVFEGAERLALRTKRSRSRIFSDATLLGHRGRGVA